LVAWKNLSNSRIGDGNRCLSHDLENPRYASNAVKSTCLTLSVKNFVLHALHTKGMTPKNLRIAVKHVVG
jgi:hypothetical protein